MVFARSPERQEDRSSNLTSRQGAAMHTTIIRVGAAAAVATLAAAALATVSAAKASDAPERTTDPHVTGTARVGSTLRTTNGGWRNDPGRFRYHWYRCRSLAKDGCARIGGATDRRYRLVAADAGHAMISVVTACNADGCATNDSNAVGPVQGNAPPVNTAAPATSGSALVGSVLTASTGSWTNGPTRFSFQWLRCDSGGANCGAIGGATARRYTLTVDDVGSTLRVRVTARNGRGSGTAASGQTGVVGTGTGGSAVPVSTISLPDRLVVSGIAFQPSVLRARGPFTASFTVTDSKGRKVAGALVYVIGLPYGWLASAREVPTDANGVATIPLTATRAVPRRGSIVMFVRARKPGEPLLGGVSSRRLVQLDVRL
jgi:hypothetical protein